MIIVRWTAPASLDLEGTYEELSLAAKEIREVPGGQCCGISAEVRGDPAPYDATLSLVLVEAAGDRLRVRVDCLSLDPIRQPLAFVDFIGCPNEVCHLLEGQSGYIVVPVSNA